MRLKTAILTILATMAISAQAAPQWNSQEFRALVDGDDIIADSKIAGTSSIIILSNTLGMQGIGQEKTPIKNLYMVVERDFGAYDRDFVINLKPLLEDMEARGANTIDLGFKFEIGDEIEIVGPYDDGIKWKYDDFDLDAVTPGFQPRLDRDDFHREGFNPDYGVDNYFQHYVDDDDDEFNGTFVWTFGDGIPDPGLYGPDPGTGASLNGPQDDIPQVSGQPLPGTLATVLLGAGLCAATTRKKENNL